MAKRKEALHLPGHRSAQDAHQRPQAQHHSLFGRYYDLAKRFTDFSTFRFPTLPKVLTSIGSR